MTLLALPALFLLLAPQEPGPPWWEAWADGSAGPPELLAWAGLPPEAGVAAGPALAAALEALEGQGAPEGLLPCLVAAALVPERVSGIEPLPAEESRRRVAELLPVLLAGEEDFDRAVVAARLRPWLDAGHLQALAALLKARPPHAETGLHLFLVAPPAVARPFWTAFVLDPGQHLQARLRVLDRLLRVVGPEALADLRPLLGAGTDPALLRRLLVDLAPGLRPEDRPLLARLAAAGDPGVRALALQVWGAWETEEGERLRVFGLAEELPFEDRLPVLEALARKGRHAGIAERLLPWLDSGRPERRAAALRLVPAFAGPEALFEAWMRRLERGAGRRERGLWARQLALLPLPEARAAAARWLVEEGGWEEGSLARVVARSLFRSPDFDPWLPRWLRLGGAPEDLRFQAAVLRAESSEAAREELRRFLREGSGPRQAEAARVLGRLGAAADLAQLQDLARDPGAHPPARAAALRALAASRHGPELLSRLLAEASTAEPYEVLEALLRSAAGAGLAVEARMHLLSWTESLPEGYAPSLRRALWGAWADRPQGLEVEALARDLAEVLRARVLDPEAELRPVSEPRTLAVEEADTRLAAAALAAALTPGSGALGGVPEAEAELRLLDLAGVAASALLVAAAELQRALPDFAWSCWLEIAGREEVPLRTRLRAQAGAARAAWGEDPARGLEALRVLSSDARVLYEHPWDLAWGLGRAEARGWVLALDRLVERGVLVRARLEAEEEARASVLAALLPGFVAAPHLVEAASLLDPAGPASATALALARRAAEWGPDLPEAWEHLARVLEARGEGEKARRAWARGLRLLPPSDPRRSLWASRAGIPAG